LFSSGLKSSAADRRSVWTCSHDWMLLAKSSSLHFLLKQATKQA